MSQLIDLRPAYPTADHERAAHTIVDYFTHVPATEAILLVGSCARGKAVPGSCIDIAILVQPEVTRKERAEMERAWTDESATNPSVVAMRRHGPFAHVDLDIDDGRFEPGYHGWTSGPDAFELEIGNTLVYGVPLRQRGNYYHALRENTSRSWRSWICPSCTPSSRYCSRSTPLRAEKSQRRDERSSTCIPATWTCSPENGPHED